MAIISITELKSVLGIGSIYPDAEVQQVADAASDIILSYLEFNRSSIVAVELEDNVATYYTVEPHDFVVGSALTVTGCPTTFNGSRTVTARRAASFDVSITAADVIETPIRPYGRAVLTSQAALYDANASVREACLALAVDIWETRKGTMGQQGVDFAPAPYRLGRSMLQRIMGLLGKDVDTNSMVG
jgi:hypothetical protein